MTGAAGSLGLTDVTRRFGGPTSPPAVDHLTLSVAEGELLAIVGASGSGKTTTLRIVAGYEPADEGRVTLDDRDITRLAPQKRDFGMVFQHYALFPHLSVEENVAFGLEARRVGRQERLTRARHALAGVGLAGAGPRPVQSLSGGEQQRVAIAAAAARGARLVLADEPTGELDQHNEGIVLEALEKLSHEYKSTVVVVTHSERVAARAGRVVEMRDGKVAA